jgi:hypothetical protein
MSTDPAKTVAGGVVSCAKLLAKAAKNNAVANKVDLMLIVFFMFKNLIVTNRFEKLNVIYLKNWHKNSRSVILINLKTEILIQNKTDLVLLKSYFFIEILRVEKYPNQVLLCLH